MVVQQVNSCQNGDRRMATMKEIAKRANVSIATVSAVVNQSAFVSEELTKRVNKAIEELNYKPNAVARSLKMKSTNTVGVIVTDILNPYYPALVKSMDDIAIRHHFSLILCNTSNDREKFLAHLDMMNEKRVDGLILANISNQEDLEEVEKTGLNYVLMNRKPITYQKKYVGIDNQMISELAVQHLFSHGYERIAYFGGDPTISTARQMLRGFVHGMKKHGLEIDQSLIFDGSYSQQSGYEIVKSLIHSVKKLPRAILTASDMQALGVYKGLKEQGIRVPEDVALMGSDNTPFAEDFVVPLSTVDHQLYKMGELAMNFLLQKDRKKEQIILNPTLIVRESCGCRPV